ncbi:hypothetical protein BpHYR1_016245 [Brachionus plicatilis]|uniref:Uncharacterized protein n=1 Tax=Brachionus plicatilis TaxID=10195 RepID=A0A3M7RIK9_BRAPC|nr:hypothetical protein BpHYR1_016245 [Brachionus plicatilis]
MNAKLTLPIDVFANIYQLLISGSLFTLFVEKPLQNLFSNHKKVNLGRKNISQKTESHSKLT